MDAEVSAVLTANAFHVAGTPDQRREARKVAGDLKQFWREATAENLAAIQKKTTRTEADVTGPLPTFVSTQIQTTWFGYCHFELLPAWKLAPNQQGRLHREFEKAALTLWQMFKVRTMPQARHDRALTSLPLDKMGATNVSLQFKGEEMDPAQIEIMSQYLDALWIWMTNCAYNGVTARQPDGTKIPASAPGGDAPYCRWDTALHYHFYAKEKATTTLPDGHLPTVAQVREADEKTREVWMRHTGPDAPVRLTLDAAIKKATQESHHLWVWTSAASSPASHGSPAGKRGLQGGANMPDAKKPKTGRHCKGQELCKKHNDDRGCRNPCPDKKRHGCDVLIADNECCGGNHARSACPHAATSHSYRNDR